MLWTAVALVAVVGALALLAVALRQRRRRPDEVGRFLRARELTTEWARHPAPPALAPVPAERERD